MFLVLWIYPCRIHIWYVFFFFMNTNMFVVKMYVKQQCASLMWPDVTRLFLIWKNFFEGYLHSPTTWPGYNRMFVEINSESSPYIEKEMHNASWRNMNSSWWSSTTCRTLYEVGPYKWLYKCITGVTTLLIGVYFTSFITGRGPPCMGCPYLVGCPSSICLLPFWCGKVGEFFGKWWISYLIHTWVYVPDPECFVSHLPHIIHGTGIFITYLCWILMGNGTVNIQSSHGCYAWVWISGTSSSKFQLGKLASCYRVFFWRYAWFVGFFSPPCFNTRKKNQDRKFGQQKDNY